MSQPFADLPLFSFDLIMADPPWLYRMWSQKGAEKNATAHYDCMDLNAIKSLPVGELAAPDCVLWLWATNPMLPQALEVVDAWGFRFVTAGTWVKQSKTGAKLHFGTGYVLRSANEPFLIACNGTPETAKNIRSVIMAPVREHSRKPDAAFDAAAALVAPQTAPHAPRLLELFSRQKRPGWSNWGDEDSKFNETNTEAGPPARDGEPVDEILL